MALEECGRNLAQRDLLHYKRNTEHYSGNMMHDLRESLLILHKPHLLVIMFHTITKRVHVALKTKVTRVMSRYCMHRQGLYISA
jgi:inosine-uridine nucleoside N-ribohydrolase